MSRPDSAGAPGPQPGGWAGRAFRALARAFGHAGRRESSGFAPGPAAARPALDLVILLDGTMSSLAPGAQTNIGLIWQLLREEAGQRRLVYYEAGVQWEGWRSLGDVAQGRGLDRQILRAYGWLATRYRPGDRIFLMGYSRGAYGVRSLAGMIDRLGLLRAEEATVRNIRQAWRHYQSGAASEAAQSFGRLFCHPRVAIEMIGVFDTVKALGLRLPLVWTLTERDHAFHDHRLGPSVRSGFHALALDERRLAYTPVMWSLPPGGVPQDAQRVEQVWFPGAHGDVGGQLGSFGRARPLSNLPLVWMLDCAESRGLGLPQGWRARFPTDETAPAVGCWRGAAALFLLRGTRRVGAEAGEWLHPSARVSPRLRRRGARLPAPWLVAARLPEAPLALPPLTQGGVPGGSAAR